MASRLPEAVLRKGFGVFVLCMGVLVLTQEHPAPYGLMPPALTAALAALVLVCRLVSTGCPLLPLLPLLWPQT